LRLGGKYGSGSIDTGTSIDLDSADSQRLGLSGFPISKSTADTDGQVTLFDVDVFVRFTSLLKPAKPFRGTADLVLGYQYYEDKLTDRNMLQQVVYGEPFLKAIEGLDSTFRYEWQAVRMGVRGEYPLSTNFIVNGSAMLLMGLDYRGDGFWNLREDLRTQSPNFVQTSSSAMGMEIRAGLAYRMTDNIAIEGGYWMIQWDAGDGRQTLYRANGARESIAVSSIEDVRDGFYLSINGRF
jgi:hypothetical protein